MVYRLGRSLGFISGRGHPSLKLFGGKAMWIFSLLWNSGSAHTLAGLLGGSWEFDHPVAVFFWTWKGPMTMSPRDPVGSRGYVFLAQSQICL